MTRLAAGKDPGAGDGQAADRGAPRPVAVLAGRPQAPLIATSGVAPRVRWRQRATLLLYLAVSYTAVLAALLAQPLDAASVAARRVTLGDGRWAAIDERHEIWVEALPQRGEGMLAFSRRLTGADRHAREIGRYNGRDRLLAGVRTRVPLDLLTAELQARALVALFPKSRGEDGVWLHQAVGLGRAKLESLAHVARWLTGSSDQAAALGRLNALGGDELRAGQTLRVPAELLRPALRSRVPAPPRVATAAPTASAGGSTAAASSRPPTKLATAEPASPASTVSATASPAGAAPPAVSPAAGPTQAASGTGGSVQPPRAPIVHAAAPGSRPGGAENAAVAAAAPAAGPVTVESGARGTLTIHNTGGEAVRAASPAAVGVGAPIGSALATISAAPGSTSPVAATAGGPAAPVPSPAAVAPPPRAVSPTTLVPAASGGNYRLEYGRDAQGDYALYRLRGGEALYSSVVVRFTGRIHAEDVNALAVEVARRSGIVDVTDIPIGYAVKIPFDVLLPEFLPINHPRRLEYEASLAASDELASPVVASGLDGVTVVLDAGHGGRDIGASFGGVWESLYAYDVVLRIKQSLETYTAAKVYTTTVDDNGYTVIDRDVLPFSRSHRVLTTPPYVIEDSTTGVHLRWYLANSVLRRAVAERADPAKVIFLSIHADSLHPSIRGAMAYIPGAEGRGGSFGKSGNLFAARKEYKEQPTVRYSSRELLESEGRSRDLARHLIEGMRGQGLAIHPFKPIRESVIRNRREWVPAVLRYNAIPAKLLLEICNLANEEDRRLVQTRAFRQQVADSVVQGILAYYGYTTDLGGQTVAAARR